MLAIDTCRVVLLKKKEYRFIMHTPFPCAITKVIDDWTQAKSFFDQMNLTSGRPALEQALERIRSNIFWKNSIEPELSQWLQRAHQPEGLWGHTLARKQSIQWPLGTLTLLDNHQCPTHDAKRNRDEDTSPLAAKHCATGWGFLLVPGIGEIQEMRERSCSVLPEKCGKYFWESRKTQNSSSCLLKVQCYPLHVILCSDTVQHLL